MAPSESPELLPKQARDPSSSAHAHNNDRNGNHDKDASPSRSRATGSGSVQVLGKLRVQVVGARDLVGKDRNGKSDPFVIMNLPGAPPPTPAAILAAHHNHGSMYSTTNRDRDFYRRATPVQPKTLEPKWKPKDATFEWDITTDWLALEESNGSTATAESNGSTATAEQSVDSGSGTAGQSCTGEGHLKPLTSAVPPRQQRPSNVRKLSTATGKMLIAPVRMTTKGAIATTRVIKKGGRSVRTRPRPMRLRRNHPNVQGQAPAGSGALHANHNEAQDHRGFAGAIEFVVWDKDKWSGNDYLGEASLRAVEWVTHGKSALWEASEVLTLPLRSARRNTKVSGELMVRIGLVPTDENINADNLYALLIEGSNDMDNFGIRSIPADQSVGTSGPTEAFLDDGLSSDSESEAREELLSDDELSAADDTDLERRDEEDSDGLLSVTDPEDSSDNDAGRRVSSSGIDHLTVPQHRQGSISQDTSGDEMAIREGAEIDGPEGTKRTRRTIVGRLRKTGSYIIPGRRSGSESVSSGQGQAASGAVSDAADGDPTSAVAETGEKNQERRRLRMKAPMPRRKPRKQGTDPSVESVNDAARPSNRGARRRIRKEARRRQQQDFSLKTSQGKDIIGIVQMEVKSASDLPRWRNSIGTSFDMDAFVIVSFGQRIFRTRVARHSLNPTWDEKLLFHVRRHETGFVTKLAVYDWDKLSSNDFVGDCNLPILDLIEAAPTPDPITGLYAESDGETSEMKSFSLPLHRGERGEDGKHIAGKHDSKLNIQARFTPYAALRQRFWRQILRQYDSNDSGTLNSLELTAMLDSLGSTLSTKTINDIFQHYGKQDLDADAEEGDLELTIDQAIIALEAEIMKPFGQKRIVHGVTTGAGILDESNISGLQTPAEENAPPMRGIDYAGPQAPLAGQETMLASDKQVVPPDAVDGPTHTGRFARALHHDESKGSLLSTTSSYSSSSAGAAPTASPRIIQAQEQSSISKADNNGDAVDQSNLDEDQSDEQDQVERVIVLRSCPLCRMPRLSKKAEVDIVTHLAVCASQDWRRVDSMVVGNYVTAMQAHRKWVTKVITKISQGQYQLGANSANIIVQDRQTGQLLEEKMQAYVRLGIRMLYKGARSRMEGARIKRMLKNMSVKQGVKYDSPHSAREIPHFIAFHGLNVDEIRDPIDSFKTFNEFFYRKLKPEARPVEDVEDPRTLVSGADCRLMVFDSVTEATKIWIKGRDFTIERLLGDGFLPRKQKVSTWAQELDKYRHGGAFSIFRLAPQDYHRFHCPADCTVGPITTIEGQYYTVNPMAIRSAIDVYCENVRVIVPLISEAFGTFYYVCIGAMMVGSTVLTVKEGDRLKRGDEIGFFKFGGSTICMSFPENTVHFDDDLLTNSSRAIETLVRVGMRIGRSSLAETAHPKAS